jgi:hypothetical protein
MPGQANQPLPPGADSGASSDVQAKAAEVAGQAQEKAQQAAGQVQDKLREQIDQRSSQAATQITEQASDLRSVSQSLREQGKDGPAKAADRLAEYAEKVGGYLRDKNSDALLADAEDFGRRQPWAIAAGGLALGFAASRFLKASSSQRYQGRQTVPRPAGVYSTPAPLLGDGMSGQPRSSRLGSGSGTVM